MITIEWTFQLRFLVALALGFLVGLERESTKIEQQKLVFGGVRTHPIISMFGFGCAWLFQIGATFMLPAGLLAMATLTAIAYVAKIRGERFGSTSEISALLTFVTGALALLVDIWVAMAAGIVNAMLLSEKARLERFVERLDKAEFLATLKFLLVTLIILPVLPDREYTWFNLNPASIWKLVILVSTIGFVGYALSKKFGKKVGLWLSGVLGGIVSSTALTVAAGRMAQNSPSRSHDALQAAMLAGSVMYIRILVIVAIVSPALLPMMWWRFVALAIIGVLLSIRIHRDTREADGSEVPGLENPFEITPALWFAALFVLLTMATQIVKSYVGTSGVFALSAVVGVTDIDPYILSLVQNAALFQGIVAAGITIAMMSNVVAKGAYFSFLVPSIRRETAWRYALWAALHVPFILIP